MTSTREEKEKLFLDNRGLVFYVIKQYTIPKHVDFDDVLQVGYMALWRCINDDGYDPTKGKLATYFRKYIETDVRNFLWENVDNDGFRVNHQARKENNKIKDLRRRGLSDEEIAEEINRNSKRQVRVSTVKAMNALGRPSESLYCVDEDGDEYDNPKLPKNTDAGYEEIEKGELRAALEAEIEEHLNEVEADAVRMYFGFYGDPVTGADFGRKYGKSDEWGRIQVRRGLAKLRHPRCSKVLNDYR